MDTCPGGRNVNEKRSPSLEYSLSVVMVAFWRMECLPGWRVVLGRGGRYGCLGVTRLVRAGPFNVRYLICLE